MRLFLALDAELLSRELKENIDYLSSRYKSVEWQPVDNCHITVKFLGSIIDSEVPYIVSNLANSVGRTHPFVYRLSNLGIFHDAAGPRYIYRTIKSGELMRLRHQVDVALRLFDSEFEFTPHITLGRIDSDIDRTDKDNLERQLLQEKFGVPKSVTAKALNIYETIKNDDTGIVQYRLEKSFAFAG